MGALANDVLLHTVDPVEQDDAVSTLHCRRACARRTAASAHVGGLGARRGEKSPVPSAPNPPPPNSPPSLSHQHAPLYMDACRKLPAAPRPMAHAASRFAMFFNFFLSNTSAEYRARTRTKHARTRTHTHVVSKGQSERALRHSPRPRAFAPARTSARTHVAFLALGPHRPHLPIHTYGLVGPTASDSSPTGLGLGAHMHFFELASIAGCLCDSAFCSLRPPPSSSLRSSPSRSSPSRPFF